MFQLIFKTCGELSSIDPNSTGIHVLESFNTMLVHFGAFFKAFDIFSSHRRALGTALSQDVKGKGKEKEEDPVKLMFL